MVKDRQKIVAYKVKPRMTARCADVPRMTWCIHETVLRRATDGHHLQTETPEHVSEHSLFITINDIIS